MARGNLKFGKFTLKSGRVSPYFFNAGGFDDGRSLEVLSACYAQAILEIGPCLCQQLFGIVLSVVNGATLVKVAACLSDKFFVSCTHVQDLNEAFFLFLREIVAVETIDNH